MKKVTFIAVLLIAAAQFSFTISAVSMKQTSKNVTPSGPAISFTSNESIDFPFSVYIPCAGEYADLEGQLHVLYHITMNDNRVTVKTQGQPQGISGVGSVSGERYQATGVTHDTFTGSLTDGQFAYTYVNNFRIIGQSTGNNYLVHETYHVTVNTNGTTTTVIDNVSIECK